MVKEERIEDLTITITSSDMTQGNYFPQFNYKQVV